MWVWAIRKKDTTELVGTCALVDKDNETMEIGLRFIERFWGRGYAKELFPELIDYAFKSYSITSLYGEADSRNLASVKLLEQYFDFQQEIFNATEPCWDRQYLLKRSK